MDRRDGLTYLLIDGENIDATLGGSILGGRPAPDERPRWERLVRFFEDRWGQQVRALFFIAVHGDNLPMPFIQALTAIGYTPVPLTGPSDVKVVDVAIMRTLTTLAERVGQGPLDVVLASHDGDFVPNVERLADAGHRVAVVGFREFMSTGFADLAHDGVELLDLEYDVDAFTFRLPRLRVIPIDEYDPADFL